MRHQIPLTFVASLMAMAEPRAPAAAPTPCSPPDSATAPAWFWDSAAAFGGNAEFGGAQIDVIATRTELASARDIGRAQGTYSLVLITLTPEGPSAPDANRLVLRRPTPTELKRVVGDGFDQYAPGVLVGSIKSIASPGADTASREPVQAIVWSAGMELALGDGLFGEDGPERLWVVVSDSTSARGWWAPGSSIVPPPHGYFCLVRVH